MPLTCRRVGMRMALVSAIVSNNEGATKRGSPREAGSLSLSSPKGVQVACRSSACVRNPHSAHIVQGRRLCGPSTFDGGCRPPSCRAERHRARRPCGEGEMVSQGRSWSWRWTCRRCRGSAQLFHWTRRIFSSSQNSFQKFSLSGKRFDWLKIPLFAFSKTMNWT